MNKFFVVLSGVLLCMPCYGSRNIDHAASGWLGDVNPLYCGYHNFPDACIGNSATDGCRPYGLPAGKNSNTYGILVMMARKITANGALFCPTQIDPVREGKNLWTYYREPNNNNTCVWLCREGWTGSKCSVKVTESFSSGCDVIPFLRSNYDNARLHYGGENIEFEVPLFTVDNVACSGRRGEYDIALLVNKWLDSGNGAFIRKMMVRTRREASGDASTIMVYPATNSMDVLVCKNGYRPNASKTDCEPIDATACNKAIISSKMCAKWTLSAYDDTQHQYVVDGTCYRYSCKEAGYAFVSETDHTCVECVTDKRNGVHPTKGTCVKCSVGEIFSESNANNSYCSVAVGLTKTDLMYGRGQTKNTNSDLNKQCWIQGDAQRYRDCVMNGGMSEEVKIKTTNLPIKESD